MKKDQYIEIVSLLFSALFLYSGIDKLTGYSVFREQIGLTPLMSPIAGVLAWLVPVAEVIIGLGLLLPSSRVPTLGMALGVMLLFTGYVIYLLNYDDQLPCSCGGLLESLSWTGHLIFNGICITLSTTALLWHYRDRQTKSEGKSLFYN
ncbi:MauE/DoxX family redox-associated membrane protein [[Flexibacter] sp. ATCC 35208]|uniref:MauE/DoxX family redox-associated membrane protein n=1 Tax=[Flexibacter] sp. ATCC 35208 TaxID=1936242 RepID=UPI0009CC21CD|nr:MauE/DoxX family redox-associated membrane protein [[Flexibacter] sp. ATCC 35208]OMP80063.1 hypothetical protein BW716_06100 [[Flexibacter] sp. ATCC 35208]